MSELILIVALSVTVLTIVASFLLINSYNETSKESIKFNFDPKDFIINELFLGRIKCNFLSNNSSPYNVDKWTVQIKQFIKRPIFKQLMSLEGNEKNEEN